MSKSNVTGSISPVAFVCKNKQRIKQYNGSVYLKNGDEFELELFNPETIKVLARIEFNGQSIGPGIILRPGERVFLERYIHDPRKFKFDVYEADGGNIEEVSKAIKDNGNVFVKFFKETTYVDYPTIDYLRTDYGNNTEISTYPFNNVLYTTASTGQINTSEKSGPSSCTNFCESILDENVNLSGNGSTNNIVSGSKKESIETGRIDKGSHSDQKFDKDYSAFENFPSWSSEWKILPELVKQVTVDDMAIYCNKCGRKKRVNENYCPKCGEIFNDEPSDPIVGDYVEMTIGSYIEKISKDGCGEPIYYVQNNGDYRWFYKHQLEFPTGNKVKRLF
jgi:hypothetical protein